MIETIIWALLILQIANMILGSYKWRLKRVQGADRRLVTADAERPEEPDGEEQRSVDDRGVTAGEATAVCSFAENVALQVRERAKAGLAKYGVTAERTDIDFAGWLQHLQEELLDAAVYIERLKAEPDSEALKERSGRRNAQDDSRDKSR